MNAKQRYQHKRIDTDMIQGRIHNVPKHQTTFSKNCMKSINLCSGRMLSIQIHQCQLISLDLYAKEFISGIFNEFAVLYTSSFFWELILSMFYLNDNVERCVLLWLFWLSSKQSGVQKLLNQKRILVVHHVHIKIL